MFFIVIKNGFTGVFTNFGIDIFNLFKNWEKLTFWQLLKNIHMKHFQVKRVLFIIIHILNHKYHRYEL